MRRSDPAGTGKPAPVNPACDVQVGDLVVRLSVWPVCIRNEAQDSKKRLGRNRKSSWAYTSKGVWHENYKNLYRTGEWFCLRQTEQEIGKNRSQLSAAGRPPPLANCESREASEDEAAFSIPGGAKALQDAAIVSTKSANCVCLDSRRNVSENVKV